MPPVDISDSSGNPRGSLNNKKRSEKDDSEKKKLVVDSKKVDSVSQTALVISHNSLNDDHNDENQPNIIITARNSMVALIAGLFSIWIAFMGISSQTVMGTTLGISPWIVGFFITLPTTFLWIPLMLILLCGIFGLPSSICDLLMGAEKTFWPQNPTIGVDKFLRTEFRFEFEILIRFLAFVFWIPIVLFASMLDIFVDKKNLGKKYVDYAYDAASPFSSALTTLLRNMVQCPEKPYESPSKNSVVMFVGMLLYNLTLLGTFAFNILTCLLPKNPENWCRREPCKYYKPDENETKTKTASYYDREKWIFINGIATTKAIADTNRDQLFKMFGRPIHLVHNPTDGIFMDLFECVAEKTGLLQLFTNEAKNKLKEVLANSLLDADSKMLDKIVLIAHSQGTIITGNALAELGSDCNFLRTLMQTHLEVYNFADCAHQMPADNVKYLENISNKGDLVAWLGHLFPLPWFWVNDKLEPIDITCDKSIVEPARWGHLLNANYLLPLERNHRRQLYSQSELINYMLHHKRSHCHCHCHCHC